MLRGLLLGCCVCGGAARAVAQPPDVTALYPAGGQRGTEVRVALRGKADAEALQVWFDRPGIEVAGADGKEALKLKLAADATPGTVWLRLHSPEGASLLKPFVIGAARELPEAEPNDALPQAQAAGELPVVLNGTLEKYGEVDTFRVMLKQGETLAAMLAAKQALGSPMDGLLQATDAKGFVLEQNDDRRGFDPQLVLTAPKDGDYFIRVFAFPAQPDTTVQFSGAATYVYRLTLTTGPLMDHVQPCAVRADQPAKARPFGWNLPLDAGEIDLAPLPAGVRLIHRDGWLSTAKVLALPLPSVVELEPNPLAQPQTVTVPGVLCGEIGAAKDIDAWKFAATANQRVSLRLAAVALGSALDAVVRIFDAAGQKLSEVDDAPQDEADLVLEFTAPKDGEFVVTVTDRYAHGGTGYWYALALAEPQPAALLQVAGENFVVKAETPLEIPVTVERRLGHALTLNLAIDGLPEGVTTAPLRSETVDKQVKLVLTSTRAERWSGPIRIVGRAEGDAVPERVAQFKSPLTDEWLPHLWLTVGPK